MKSSGASLETSSSGADSEETVYTEVSPGSCSTRNNSPLVIHCDPRFKIANLTPLIPTEDRFLALERPPKLQDYIPIEVFSDKEYDDQGIYDRANILLQVRNEFTGSLNLFDIRLLGSLGSFWDRVKGAEATCRGVRGNQASVLLARISRNGTSTAVLATQEAEVVFGAGAARNADWADHAGLLSGKEEFDRCLHRLSGY